MPVSYVPLTGISEIKLENRHEAAAGRALAFNRAQDPTGINLMTKGR